MNPHYNQNYSRKDISDILKIIKTCIISNRYTLSLNSRRKENIDFINNYNITSIRQREILMNIEVDDFCYSLKNTKEGYEDEVLYVFAPNVHLYNIDGFKEIVDLYIKFNILKLISGNRIIVISFHKVNKAVQYLFREDKV